MVSWGLKSDKDTTVDIKSGKKTYTEVPIQNVYFKPIGLSRIKEGGNEGINEIVEMTKAYEEENIEIDKEITENERQGADTPVWAALLPKEEVEDALKENLQELKETKFKNLQELEALYMYLLSYEKRQKTAAPYIVYAHDKLKEIGKEMTNLSRYKPEVKEEKEGGRKRRTRKKSGQPRK